MLRLTKAIREKLLQQNEGFTRSTYYDSKNFEEKRIYKIIDGVLHIHEEGKTSWADSRYNRDRIADDEETHRFLKKFFAEYVQTHMNEVAALNIVCTRPKELTREALKNLRLLLDREGFTVSQLNTAISQMTNEEITADIISLIRRYAIGSALISHEDRIHKAVSKLKSVHSFSKQELNWIARMEKYLIEESVLNVSVFDEDGRFKSKGGFDKINKVFQNNLESIVLELNEYLYDDGGRTA